MKLKMIDYAIRNKKDGRFVYGFDFRYGSYKPHMRYIENNIKKYVYPKLISLFDYENNSSIIGYIPKCCELVKVEIKEVEK